MPVVDDFGNLVSPRAPNAKVALVKPVFTRAAKVVAVVANPKKPGTPSYDRFALWAVGDTVDDYVKKAGKKGAADVRWDLARGFVTLG
jgi:hypothetical protein